MKKILIGKKSILVENGDLNWFGFFILELC